MRSRCWFAGDGCDADAFTTSKLSRLLVTRRNLVTISRASRCRAEFGALLAQLLCRGRGDERAVAIYVDSVRKEHEEDGRNPPAGPIEEPVQLLFPATPSTLQRYQSHEISLVYGY